MTRRKEVESMMKYCTQEFGGIDVLINNAGISQQKLFTEITEEDFNEIITGNLTSAFHCTQAALKYMLPEKAGKIINISSNLQVNCIAPGVIQTDMLSDLNETELNNLKNDTPLMRLGLPQDIAEFALFLASTHANFTTGQIISPNGGFVI